MQMENKYWKKVASNLKWLVLWRNLDLYDNIDKQWKRQTKNRFQFHINASISFF